MNFCINQKAELSPAICFSSKGSYSLYCKALFHSLFVNSNKSFLDHFNRITVACANKRLHQAGRDGRLLFGLVW